jgi:hypothetical protein
MKNGTPRQLPDLQTAPNQPSDHEQELLSWRIKILEQRLLMLKGDVGCSVHPKIARDQPDRKPSRRLVELGLLKAKGK